MTRDPYIIQEIRSIVQGRMHTDVPLSRYTSFRIGGPADVVVEPRSVAVLQDILAFLQARKTPRMILGGGTNVLFSDRGFRGVVIRTNSLRKFEIHENGSGSCRMTVGAGTTLPALIKRASMAGFTGLESLCGIPGSFAGAVAGNAGAGGVAMADLVEELRLISRSGEETVISHPALGSRYRAVDVPEGSCVVEGTVKLARGDIECIRMALGEARFRRRATQPWREPSAGCVFKNPSPDTPAGAIIDRLGLKGAAVGGAQVSPVHANFIVNRGKATAADVIALMERIRETVRREYTLNLEPEIRIIEECAPHG